MKLMDMYDLRELPVHEKIVIYGAGTAGKAFMHLLLSMRRDVDILGFADSFQTGELEGKKIFNVEELSALDYDRIVVCSYQAEEICAELEQRGFDRFFAYTSLRTRVVETKMSQCCQAEQLYIRWDGSVFPCCYMSRCEDALIGHVSDPDLQVKIRDFQFPGCSCDAFVFEAHDQKKPFELKMVTVETSLACQAECAMCCVHAPGWTGRYRWDTAVDDFLIAAAPESVHFQGGEVLIQKQVMDRLPGLRAKMPETAFLLLTNGSVGAAVTQRAGDVFDKIWITISGFQPDTYRFVMGLDFDKTMAFIDTLHARSDVEVWVKYLIVPSTIHELGRFLRWAAEKGFKGVGVDVALRIEEYISFETRDKYWAKLLDRVSRDVRQILVDEKERFEQQGQGIDFTLRARNFLNLSDEFFCEHKMSPVIVPNAEDWKRWGRPNRLK